MPDMPVDMFTHFFTNDLDLIDKIVVQTNLYASQVHQQLGEDTVEELKAYFGFCNLMV